MHKPCSDPRPTYNQTVAVVADALVEVRETNRCCHPNDKINEDTFIIGAATLFMGETFVPGGSAMGYMSAAIKETASQWKK